MRKVFFAPTRTWVGESSCPQDSTHFALPPAADDPRWIKEVPTILDTDVLTLSPFRPTGRLDVCVERKNSKPLTRYPNYPPFAGVVAWMPLSALEPVPHNV